MALIPIAPPVVYASVDIQSCEKRPSMKNGGRAGVWRWRQFGVDVLIGAATMAVAFAAIASTVDVLYLLLISGALVGIGLMLEPSVKEHPAGDIGPQALQLLTEPKPA